LIAFGSSLDQIGPFARSVLDAALVFQTLAGYDPRDSTSAPMAEPLRRRMVTCGMCRSSAAGRELLDVRD